MLGVDDLGILVELASGNAPAVAGVFGVATAVVAMQARAHRTSVRTYDSTRANLQSEQARLLKRNQDLDEALDEALARERQVVAENRGLQSKVDGLERQVARQAGDLEDLRAVVDELRTELARRAGDDGRRAP